MSAGKSLAFSAITMSVGGLYLWGAMVSNYERMNVAIVVGIIFGTWGLLVLIQEFTAPEAVAERVKSLWSQASKKMKAVLDE